MSIFRLSLPRPVLAGAAFCASALTLFCASLAPAHAADGAYPDGPIRLVVPATAGGTTDVLARVVAQHMSQAWGVAVIVDNRAGAGGVIGASYVVSSKPDGRTVLIAPSAFGVRSALDRKLPYDPLKDLAGVGLMARSPSFLAVSPALKVKSLAELAAYAKAQPEGVSYGSAGMGSTGHLHAAQFAAVYGFAGVHVPYRGTPEALTDVMQNRVQYAFAPGPNALPLARDGRLVLLGATSAAASKFMPGVPVVNQPGMTDFETDDWFGALVPGATPIAVRQKLSAEIARILALPEVRKRLEDVGAEPQSSTPEQFDALLQRYVATIRTLGEEMQIKLE
ncbi:MULTISPECIES: tripartite tricarboxylate transporter substrate binding protein [unclassified Achromobacter]|uniref:Bug family tripartite tricarboxylate transporter substrate binding protein n=1 Tax=unclassified Achromobacter TaxID=2626865 RepID=UPI001303CC48|nr:MULTISPECIES: tripartite tricarboxylate transporter substrate-binding protein [unclassified Achromobacter]